MEIISFLVGVVKAIPILDSWFKLAILLYVKKKQDEHDKEFRDALVSLISHFDQIPLEEAIGSATAGKPASNQEGVEARPLKKR